MRLFGWAGLLCALFFVHVAEAAVFASKGEAYAACIADAQEVVANTYSKPPYYATDYACHVDNAQDTVMYSDVYLRPWSGADYSWARVHGFHWTAPPLPSESLGPQMCGAVQTKFGNPIDAATGNKYQEESDLTGLNGERFVRYYNSRSHADRAEGALGPGWSHTYDYRVTIDSSGWSAKLFRPEGAVIELFKDRLGKWAPLSKPSLIKAEPRVEGVPDSGWIVSNGKPGGKEEYDSLGRLVALHIGTPTEVRFAYDSIAGQYRLTRATARSGRVLEFSYTPDGRIDRVTGPDGAFAQYAYTPEGVLEGATFADTTSKHYLYELDAMGKALPNRLTGIIDEAGNQFATFGYDQEGRATSSMHAGGAGKVNVSYDAYFRYVTLPSGGTHRLMIGGGPNLRVENALDYCNGCAERLVSYTYRADGSLQQIKDGNVITEVDADDCGFERRRVEASGTPVQRTFEQERDVQWLLPSELRVLDASGNVVRRERRVYGDQGQLTAAHLMGPDGDRTTSLGYCAAGADGCPFTGLLRSVQSPGHGDAGTTLFEYYTNDDSGCSANGTCRWRKGDLYRVLRPNGGISTYLAYDGAGRPLIAQDENGLTVQLTYDPRGRLASQSLQDGTSSRTTVISYTLSGQVSSIRYPDGVDLAFEYDPAQRLIKVLDDAGNFVKFTLDAAGNRTMEQSGDMSGVITRNLRRSFTLMGQLKATYDAGDNPTTYSYDAQGNEISTTDALQRKHSRAYDALAQLTKVIEDVGGIEATTHFSYDSAGSLTSVTDPKGLVTAYEYDDYGDLRAQSSPDTGTTVMSYDAAGNVQSRTDARGVTATYGYDAINRLTSIRYPDVAQNINYTYDVPASNCAAGETFAIGRLSIMIDGSGQTQYCYNRFGELVRKVQQTNGVSLVLRYAYNSAGRLVGITYPDGTVADYTRDAQGRVAEVGVTRPGGGRQVLVTEVTYLPFGPVTSWRYGNGRTYTRTYDQSYRPTGIVDSDEALKLTFGYDTVGNLSVLASGGQESVLDYDALGRLVAFKDGVAGTAIERYTYDATGNRLSFSSAAGGVAYEYPVDSHWLTSVGGEVRTYDAMGNTTSIGGTARQFTYDDRGRMSQVRRHGVLVQSYAYNAKGEQVRRWSGDGQFVTAYDEERHWLGEYDGLANPIQQVVWIGDLPVGLVSGASLFYIQPDHLGTPRVVVDPARDVAIWKWDASGEAFGSSLPNEDPDHDGALTSFALRFPGQRYDVATGLNQNGFRDGYDAASGRYTQADPIGLAGGLSTYAYVGGNPVMAVDSLGLKTCLLTTVGPGGIRDHSAIYTSQGDGSGGAALYDPAGSYGAANGGGSGAIVTGDAADIGKFTDFHKSQTVESTCKDTSRKEEESIINNAMNLPSAAPFQCATMSSSALSGLPSFPHVQAGTFWPGNLLRQFKKGL